MRLLLSFAVFSFFIIVCGARIPVTFPNTGRSTIWDSTVHQLRERRQVRSWQKGRYSLGADGLFRTSDVCTLTDITQFDELSRRNQGLLSEPLSQGMCGSCWAFASSATFTDLRNLDIGQKLDSNVISPDYATKCISTTSGNGCCGGSIGQAAAHFSDTGTTSHQCLSYTLKSYFKDIGGEENKGTSVGTNLVTCPRSCSDGSNFNPANLKLSNYRHLRNVQDSFIINTLNDVGPISVSMKTHMDFGSYLCGVYSYSGTPNGGGHAVEIVDYGTTNTGIDFWVVKNSWGPHWGENGYFRIRRGDLHIGRRPVVVQYISGQPSVQSNATNVDTCAAEEINDPQSDVFARSALEYGLQELVNRQLVKCPDGSSVNSIMRESFINATAQTVNGNMVDVTILASVQGCSRNVNPVTIELQVYVEPDGDFSLTEYDYTLNRSRATVTVSHAAIFLLTLLAVGIGAFIQ